MKLVGEGMGFRDAARAVGVSHPTVYNHLRADPNLRAQIAAVRRDQEQGRVRRGWSDTSWHAEFVRLLASGMALTDAARSVGIHRSNLYTHLEKFPNLRAKVDKIREQRFRAREEEKERKAAEQAKPKVIAVDTSWYAPFLDALRATGGNFKEASAASGVHFVRMYRRRRTDPEFERQVREVLRGLAPGMTPEARRRLLIRLSQGATLQDATEAAGLTKHQVQNARAEDPKLDQDIIARLGRASLRHDDQDERARLLANLESGMSLKSAGEAAGIPRPTVQRWRRCDEGFDRAVVEAARAGGTTLRLYPRLLCPGPRCGTKTGYDYGCGEEPCRTAAAEQVARSRRERKNRHA
ncbi:helix-turn-helix domain-containing protein [Nonomuraea sp. NPDC049655]|uniref:helix-turn-helix domain-containing protein n=1 Tax=Nonomuraea sp. NPDC049655 TaxID=3364355 RepID=UPI0037B1B0EA